MPVGNREDRHGFKENRNYLAAAVGKFVPQRLAQRGVTVSVTTDAKHYTPDEPITITATFTNRLPVPIAIRTPQQRLWGWNVDGELEASDETRYMRAKPGSFDFRPNERKCVTWEWDGRFERTDEGRWVPAEHNEHNITVFIALDKDTRPSATTIIRID